MTGRGRGLLYIFTTVVFATVVWMAPAQAAESTHSLNITASVPDTTPILSNPAVQFSGIAAPGAVVEILRGGVLQGTIIADTDANFVLILSDQPVGDQTYILTAKDNTGLALSSLTFLLNLQPGSTTVISGAFLGPTIKIDKPTFKFGEQATISGHTAPDSAVSLTVSSVAPKTFTVQADSNGAWSRIINTKDIGAGLHSAKARAVISSIVSAFSPEVTFTVSPFDPGEGKSKSDINTDGRVNLIDFSIMMFYWHQHKPANPRVDVNGDGYVDIIDFSIMLYQWKV